jgi:hypothetical protein
LVSYFGVHYFAHYLCTLFIIAAKQGDQTTLGDEIAQMQQKMQADTAAAVKQIADAANN